MNQTCGVDGCFCGMLSDLLCDEPPLPAEICIKVELYCAESCRHVETLYSATFLSSQSGQVVRPLCAAAGTNVRTSGMHGHLHNILVASIVLSASWPGHRPRYVYTMHSC